MRHLTPLFLVAALAQAAAAQSVTVVVTDEPGLYLLRLNADGTATHSPTTQSQRKGVTPNPGPGPGPGPNPDRVKRFRDVAAAIGDKETAAGLSQIYAGFAAETGSGKLYPDRASLERGLKGGLDLILGQMGKETEWAPFRSAVSKQFDELRKRGKPLEAYADCLTDASKGLAEYSGADAAAFDMTKILELLAILAEPNTPLLQKLIRALPILLQIFAGNAELQKSYDLLQGAGR